MANDGVELVNLLNDMRKRQPVRRGIDQLARRRHRCRLGKPSGIPEGANLAAGLITGPRAAIEAVERRGLQEQGLHHYPSGL